MPLLKRILKAYQMHSLKEKTYLGICLYYIINIVTRNPDNIVNYMNYSILYSIVTLKNHRISVNGCTGLDYSVIKSISHISQDKETVQLID